ncbi:tRNA 2-thiouridine(34) synthase MnmA [Desulfobacter hydrogenophilus]|uniref:tRNA-specific 2-thiouridylase MnmA n=1 Tax=Desulfobacter hydrogenophilus TaxID=2291 RepID=A0A328FD81_9BACT|nr:tRNA 2-thiouridine(34) synthase MnmA [Desulfobacter hydrogenophilus]NDY73459.1 tRNA 2-thiouridine(34) synthase MnmA [Desulfobacter hydrogenophilus]QBH14415.1 tRNA 2-thiouridine(34) synthase MnmA [Desulfobacter hydrogenophilus]RAM02259.1 tRNA 2-thiouridine(34) synthase MnmA [Desulfobacter hydrogenophilus]
MSDSPVVAVGLSGGIDSLVAGFLIKQRFKKVFGVHFTTGYEKSLTDVSALASVFGFPVHTIDLSREFETRVVDYFVSTYMAGKTPNPCIVCNMQIKFNALFDHAQKLGADLMATGHYATVINRYTPGGEKIRQAWLERGADFNKDQSYFLSMLSPDTLGRLVFPLADFTKSQVRKFAGQHDLVPVVPNESQDICFLPDKNHGAFIIAKTKVSPKPGPVVDNQGRIVGSHQGLHKFTVGQRRGINIPGPAPYYVKKIDMNTNTLHVCVKSDLAQKRMTVEQMVWNYPEKENIRELTVQIRYGHTAAPAALDWDDTRGIVTFEIPQNAVTPGQAAVFYHGNRVLGAGLISGNQ